MIFPEVMAGSKAYDVPLIFQPYFMSAVSGYCCILCFNVSRVEGRFMELVVAKVETGDL